jgi:hypothetical protein
MAISEFLPFATGSGANVITQAVWAADVLSQGQTRTNGFLGGKDALSQEANKAWRQSTFVAAAIAQYIRDAVGVDVLDNGDLAGFVANFISAIHKSAGRQKVTSGPLNYYVANSGSNSNDGLTTTTAFQTLQYAWNWIQGALDLDGNAVVVNIAPGTYGPFVAYGPILGALGPESVLFQGDLTTPTNVVVAGFNQNAITANFAQLTIKGVAVEASGSSINVGAGMASQYAPAVLLFDRISFGACSNAHWVSNRGQIGLSSAGSYTITGSAAIHVAAEGGGASSFYNTAIQILGSPTFSNGFAVAIGQGQVGSSGCSFSGPTLGPKFEVYDGGLIFTAGSGIGYFPGSVAGSADNASGGFYV